MDVVFWIILIVVIVGIVWWLLNRGSTSKTGGSQDGDSARPAGHDTAHRADGALSGGSAAASADAAGTTGLASAAGFGRPAEPMPPTTAEESSEVSAQAQDAEPVLASGPAAKTTQVPQPEVADAQVDPAAPASGAATPSDTDSDESRLSKDAEVRHPRQDAATEAGQEWETQWSEAGGASAAHSTGTHAAPVVDQDGTASSSSQVHHAEYTAPHAPTLPGAESAAAEDDAATGQAVAGAASGEAVPAGRASVEPAVAEPALVDPNLTEPALSEPSLDDSAAAGLPEPATGDAGRGPWTHDPGAATEPAGHLAADRPYGEGSASPSPDGSGPDDYPVKGDAGSMVYYEEGHPDYESTRAGVWFESPAHAEAAGFRAPRRSRLQ